MVSFLLLTMIVNFRIVIAVFRSQFHKAWTRAKAPKAEAPQARSVNVLNVEILSAELWQQIFGMILFSLFNCSCCYTIVIFLRLGLGLWAVLSMAPAVVLEYLTRLVDVLDWGRRT